LLTALKKERGEGKSLSLIARKEKKQKEYCKKEKNCHGFVWFRERQPSKASAHPWGGLRKGGQLDVILQNPIGMEGSKREGVK